MILVDTSVWVDHLRKGDPIMQRLLENGNVLMHPLVIGELAMGDLQPRETILEALLQLPAVIESDHYEALGFIAHHKLYGTGIGFVDVHLLAAVRLTSDALLWTRDKRLVRVAEALNLAFVPTS
jgi:predicted nucleic acid-binding protein